MSDSKQPGYAGTSPGAEPDAMAKAAKAAKAATRPTAAGGPEPMTLSQHLFIWTLVVLVGVIFGVGPSMRDAFVRPSQKIQGTNVDEGEAVRLARTARLLQSAIDPRMRHERFAMNDDLRSWAQRITIARLADKEGLMPSGKVLQRVVDDFLDKPLPDNRPGTYRDALREQRGETEVRQDDLEDWLRIDFANRAMSARNVHAPPVPTSSGTQVGRAIGALISPYLDSVTDHIAVDEASLTAEPFLKEIADDDADLPRTYEQLKASPVPAVRERFLTPAVAVLTVAYADIAALEAQVEPTTDEIKAYYEANKAARWQLPAKADEKKPDEKKPDEKKPDEKKPDPTYKPLDEVRPEIVAALKKQAGQKKAREAVGAFADELEESDQPDVAAFTAAAQKAGLQVAPVDVAEPSSGNPVLPGIGELKQGERELGLFSRQPGFVSGAAETKDAPDRSGTWLVLRLNERRDRQHRDLKEPAVLAYVKRQLAGRRAYGDFVAAADKLRADATAKGKGGLRAILESDEGKATWKGATVANRSYLSLEPVRPPPKEIGGLSDEPKPLISFAMPDEPVALAQAESEGEVPSLRLLQVKKYEAASVDNDLFKRMEVGIYRETIERYSQSQYYVALSRQLGR